MKIESILVVERHLFGVVGRSEKRWKYNRASVFIGWSLEQSRRGDSYEQSH